MSTDDNRRMVSRIFALLVWALVAGSGVFWSLRLFAQPAPAPVGVVAVSDLTAAAGDLSGLLGSVPAAVAVDIKATPAPALSARFRLTGVVAPKRPSEQGLAVISVDGNPPRIYRVGAYIDRDLVLREVSLRTATVAPARDSNDADAAFVLEMPAATAAATAVLPLTGFALPTDAVSAPAQVPQGVLTR